jgi:hypothetical protein
MYAHCDLVFSRRCKFILRYIELWFVAILCVLPTFRSALQFLSSKPSHSNVTLVSACESLPCHTNNRRRCTLLISRPSKGRFTLHGATRQRHNTTKTSVHSHLPSVSRQAKYSLLSLPTTLSLSLAVSDGLMWIRACENHKIIFCHVLSCRVVPYNLNRPLTCKVAESLTGSRGNCTNYDTRLEIWIKATVPELLQGIFYFQPQNSGFIRNWISRLSRLLAGCCKNTVRN